MELVSALQFSGKRAAIPPPQKKLIGSVPSNDSVGQVDGDRVHADYHE